jgi:ribosomal-protein-alanine N-acetyltransferase
MHLHPISYELTGRSDVRDSAFLMDICGMYLSRYDHASPPLPWVGYLAERNGMFVGTCAYKTPPGAHGVEIAYYTFPEFEGQGIATAMAAELVEIATREAVSPVRAQTLPEQNASCRILTKLGFVNVGSVMHPEDGEVWEWRRETL